MTKQGLLASDLLCPYVHVARCSKSRQYMQAKSTVQDPLPWSEEQTVAPTRLLWQFSFLLKIVGELEHGLARLDFMVCSAVSLC